MSDRKPRREVFRHREDWPRAGWFLVSTIDNGTAEFKCQNCGYAHVRFEHELENRESGMRVKVGCVCAEHLTEDFTGPRLRERALKSRASRRMRWPTLNWRVSAKGNLFLRKDGWVVVIKEAPRGRWVVSYTERDASEDEWIRVPGRCNTPQEAKLAAFDALYSL